MTVVRLHLRVPWVLCGGSDGGGVNILRRLMSKPFLVFARSRGQPVVVDGVAVGWLAGSFAPLSFALSRPALPLCLGPGRRGGHRALLE